MEKKKQKLEKLADIIILLVALNLLIFTFDWREHTLEVIITILIGGFFFWLCWMVFTSIKNLLSK